MFGWFRKKKPRRWRACYEVSWYSTRELQAFLQLELDLISDWARPVHEHLAFAALLENEISRRTTSTTQKNL